MILKLLLDTPVDELAAIQGVLTASISRATPLKLSLDASFDNSRILLRNTSRKSDL